MSKTKPCPTCGFICPGDTLDNKHSCVDLLNISVHHLKEQVATLQKDNDTLTAEVELLAGDEASIYFRMKAQCTENRERAEKAEAERDQMKTDSVAGWRSCIDHIIKPESSCPVCEVERLRVALETIGHECGNDLSGAANEFIKQALNHKEK